MNNLKTIESTVMAVLTESIEARNNDMKLYLLVCEKSLNMAHDVKKVYPFCASLFGWFSFLKECMKDNPYMNTFAVAPVFNYNKMIELLWVALYDQNYRHSMQLAQKTFEEQYSTLPNSEEILDTVFCIKRS